MKAVSVKLLCRYLHLVIAGAVRYCCVYQAIVRCLNVPTANVCTIFVGVDNVC